MSFGKRETIHEIELRDVSFTDSSRVNWFENVNMKVQPGESVWIMGEVVASNLLRVMAGLTAPTTGEVFINGRSLYQMTFEEFMPFRLNMAYSFSLGGILNNRTIKENIMLPFLYHGASTQLAEKRVQEILDLFDMNRYQDYRPAGVPGVMRKLCCIGRALAADPQVLMMDEPTSSMKTNVVLSLRQWVEHRRKDHPLTLIVASEHDDLFGLNECKTVMIENGKAQWLDSAKAAG